MKELLTFDDVLIEPKFSHVESRKDVNLSISTSDKVFSDIGCKFPIISANMDTITDSEMSKAMLSHGAQACLHRFCSIENNIKMLEEATLHIDDDERHRPMVSIGLGKEELGRARALYYNNATQFVIDTAHGAQLSVVKQAKALREIIGNNGAIIVGNFATGDSVKDFFHHFGGNNIEGFKVGIGPGSVCTTRIKTGVGYPQLSAILDVANFLKHRGIPVIADGGMKTPGDIAKALGAGASLVMLGGMLAGTDETPGEIVKKDTFYSNGKNIFYSNGTGEVKKFKKYRGSASKESYSIQGKDASWRTAEGESITIPYKGPVKDVLQDIEGGLRSAFSYVGAQNMKEFHKNVTFVRISNATRIENGAHAAK